MNSEAGQAVLNSNSFQAMQRHVLVVDDEPNICVALRHILEGEGYRVTTASCGEAALEAAAEDVPDVVLLDVMMPGIDGRETCTGIRSLSSTAKVVYLTGTADAHGPSSSRELLAEADDLVCKPATKVEILEAIWSVVGMSGMGVKA
jgi:CheY-like chemotaxis protein